MPGTKKGIMGQENQQLYIPIRKSQINYYKKVALYYKTANNSFARAVLQNGQQLVCPV
jgi:hypothetical protein